MAKEMMPEQKWRTHKLKWFLDFIAIDLASLSPLEAYKIFAEVRYYLWIGNRISPIYDSYSGSSFIINNIATNITAETQYQDGLKEVLEIQEALMKETEEVFRHIERVKEQGGSNSLTLCKKKATLSVELCFEIDVSEDQPQVLRDFQLVGAFPNPFNPTTTIIYRIAKTTDVKLSVYTILGQQVAELVNGKQPAGEYKIQWNAGNFSSGMYFYVLQVEGKQQIIRGILLK